MALSTEPAESLAIGERVRVVQADSEYTGCRGSVTEVALDDDGQPVGYWVAIDGENGVTRPFLADGLVRQSARKARLRWVGAESEVREA